MGFMDYLDEYQERLEKKVVKEEVKKPVKPKIVVKKQIVEQKKPYRIPPKNVITNKVNESYKRAIDILEGINDEMNINEEVHNQSIQQKPAINSVQGHAAALL
jgi:hypothetical protein